MSIGQRIKHLADEEGGMNAFAKKIDCSRATLYGIAADRGYPAFKIIKNIIEIFPELSERWLILGEGKQWKNDKAFLHRKIEMFENKSPITVWELVKNLREENSSLRDTIIRLQNKLLGEGQQ